MAKTCLLRGIRGHAPPLNFEYIQSLHFLISVGFSQHVYGLGDNTRSAPVDVLDMPYPTAWQRLLAAGP